MYNSFATWCNGKKCDSKMWKRGVADTKTANYTNHHQNLTSSLHTPKLISE